MKKDKANGALTASDGSTSYEVFKSRNKRAEQALDSIADSKKLFRIKPEAVFCNTYLPGRCFAHLQGESFYSDNNHLSNFGAKPIAREISELLTKLK